jgi:hypothetical protein
VFKHAAGRGQSIHDDADSNADGDGDGASATDRDGHTSTYQDGDAGEHGDADRHSGANGTLVARRKKQTGHLFRF